MNLAVVKSWEEDKQRS